MTRRTVQELLARATGQAVAFTKVHLSDEEIEYLTELNSFVMQTDEFILVRNPVIGSMPTPDPSDSVAPE